MTWFLLLALGAFLFKGYWWFASAKYTWADTRWYCLIAVFSLQNISEFFAYDLFSHGLSPEIFINTYYILILAVISAVYWFVCDQSDRVQNTLLISIAGGTAIFALLIVFTPYILNGYIVDSFPIKAIKGDSFSAYLSFGLGSLLLAVLIGVVNYRRLTDKKEKLQYRQEMSAFVPFILVTNIIGGGMLLGIEVNGSGLFPLASTLFMAITIHYRCKDLYLIQQQVENTTHQCMANNVGLNDAVSNYESLLLKYKIQNHNGSKSALARSLGITRQTLDRKLEKYNLQGFNLKDPDLQDVGQVTHN